MTTIDELIAKSLQARLVSDKQFDADGVEVDGGANAETVEYTFEDGEVLTVGRDVLRDEKFEHVEFRA